MDESNLSSAIAWIHQTRLVANIPLNVKLLCAFCVNLSNIINPFIYAGMNPLFKRKFKRMLCCETRQKIGCESIGEGEGNQQASIRTGTALSSMARSETNATTD